MLVLPAMLPVKQRREYRSLSWNQMNTSHILICIQIVHQGVKGTHQEGKGTHQVARGILHLVTDIQILHRMKAVIQVKIS